MKNFLILVIVALILILAPIFAWYSQELQDAYNFAYKNGITTMNSIDKADMNWW